MIRRGTYQAESEDNRWAHELVYDLWTAIEPDSEISNDGSRYDGSKYHDKPDDQEQ